MALQILIYAAFLLCTAGLRAAPLEPTSGLLFGAWLDTHPNQDTPAAFNKRLGLNATLFQMALEIPINPSEALPTHLLDGLGGNPILLLTLFPRFNYTFSGTGNDAFYQIERGTVILEVANLIAGYAANGRRVMVRIASEMNGNWYAHGQRPLRYKALWQKIVTAVRTRVASVTTSADSVAFLWSPNTGNGYPFYGGSFAPFTSSNGPYNRSTSVNATEFAALDTNGDGVLDNQDDPYDPYWPGSDYVDWVGVSLYYFGTVFPWNANVVPPSTYIRNILDGVQGVETSAANRTISEFDFYDKYASSRGYNKPMMISETASAFHVYWYGYPNVTIDPGPGELAIKQSIWREYITNETFFAAHPRIKGICLFEWAKNEEQTFRDYRITWNSTILNAFKADWLPMTQTRYLANATAVPAKNDTSKGGSTGGSTGGGSGSPPRDTFVSGSVQVSGVTTAISAGFILYAAFRYLA
ncbi:glycoside hydrolase superfamily [Fimicolochytrium jonesii]|uniref:glycoside hydrolase superfamily n=1 Tax=Fimicolochytrium jonesii TaxID=1396493 RepID=UPI0022FEC47C|nr:glycoside hydrolase superfamily [Fimicolochytrium jonesii]KAI8822567.1 glycoside hydrolase superfamily [Fimicolochytrium jonesii]